MILVEHVLGNIKQQPELNAESRGFRHDVLELEQWEAQKSRCRKTSRLGHDIGISLDRHVRLMDGDVLICDEQNKYLLTVKITLLRIMVIDLKKYSEEPLPQQMVRAFELGHLLGNQHWKAVIKDQFIYVPMAVADQMIMSALRSHGYADSVYTIIDGEKILPLLTPSESRLLFGGAEDSQVHVHVGHHH